MSCPHHFLSSDHKVSLHSYQRAHVVIGRVPAAARAFKPVQHLKQSSPVRLSAVQPIFLSPPPTKDSLMQRHLWKLRTSRKCARNSQSADDQLNHLATTQPSPDSIPSSVVCVLVAFRLIDTFFGPHVKLYREILNPLPNPNLTASPPRAM